MILRKKLISGEYYIGRLNGKWVVGRWDKTYLDGEGGFHIIVFKKYYNVSKTYKRGEEGETASFIRVEQHPKNGGDFKPQKRIKDL